MKVFAFMTIKDRRALYEDLKKTKEREEKPIPEEELEELRKEGIEPTLDDYDLELMSFDFFEVLIGLGDGVEVTEMKKGSTEKGKILDLGVGGIRIDDVSNRIKEGGQ